MSFEWIGVATVLAGVLGLTYGRRLAIPLFLVSTLLGAAAASVLTGLGSANLPPSHVLLIFMCILAIQKPHRAFLRNAFSPRSGGVFLLLTAVYALVVAAFMPRLMAGLTDVFSIGRSDDGVSELVLTPLSPSSGNLTQSVYFIGNVACFAVFYAFARDGRGKIWIANGMIACGLLNIMFAAIDYVTFYTDTATYISFIRNASYTIHDTAEIVGIKRIIGSFTEASAFASITLALMAFSLTLWLNQYPSKIVGPLSFILFLALIFSTSTTAYVSVAVYALAVLIVSLMKTVRGGATTTRRRALVFIPACACLVVAAISADATLSNAVVDLIDQLVLQKGTTDSGLERGNWNSQALINFFDSYGIGLGVGSVRASSFLLAALATIGVLGSVTFCIFLISCLAAPRREGDPRSRSIKEAAASTCIALVISSSLVGTTVDLGLMFFACAGLAASPVTTRRWPRHCLRQPVPTWQASSIAWRRRPVVSDRRPRFDGVES